MSESQEADARVALRDALYKRAEAIRLDEADIRTLIAFLSGYSPEALEAALNHVERRRPEHAASQMVWIRFVRQRMALMAMRPTETRYVLSAIAQDSPDALGKILDDVERIRKEGGR
jgi:hypothetical protein